MTFSVNQAPPCPSIRVIKTDDALCFLTVNADEAVQYGSAPMPSMLSYKVMADDNSLFK